MKNNKTIQELKDTRVKTTFEVKVTVDLPCCDVHNYLNMYLRDIIEQITKKVDSNNTDGHFTKTDDELGHSSEVFYGIEEQEEYNIHDWDI